MSINLSLKFLFSKKSHSLVNLVAVVSVVAVMVPSVAMVVILSLHNGLSGLVHSIYSDFDSELSVTPIEGQYFELDSTKLSEIRELCVVSGTVECNAVLEWEGNTAVAVVRGVDSNFVAVSGMPNTIQRGVWQTKLGELNRGVIGSGVSYNLAMPLSGGPMVGVMAVLPPTPLMRTLGVPMVNSMELRIVGAFSIEANLNSRYLFTDIGFVRELLGWTGGAGGAQRYSSLELQSRGKGSGVKEKIEEILAMEPLRVRTREQQRASIYAAIDAEKYVVWMVLIFVALVAVLSLAGCSLMMTAEKSKAIGVLRTMGMTVGRVRGVFLKLAMIIVGVGVVGGVLVGAGVVLLQQYFGVLKTAENSLVLDSYPVELMWGDVVMTVGVMCGVGFLVVWGTLRGVGFSRIK